MRKGIALLLVLCIALCMAGCGLLGRLGQTTALPKDAVLIFEAELIFDEANTASYALYELKGGIERAYIDCQFDGEDLQREVALFDAMLGYTSENGIRSVRYEFTSGGHSGFMLVNGTQLRGSFAGTYEDVAKRMSAADYARYEEEEAYIYEVLDRARSGEDILK
jgi:hypothetical protein